MELHEKIRLSRKNKGISQTFIAKKLNITTQGYSLKEKGERPIKTDELEIIANCLGIPTANFFNEKFHVKLNEHTA